MKTVAMLGMLLVSSTLIAQSPVRKPPVGAIASHPDWPKARPTDVDTVDHLLAALDGVISGTGKSARDWDRFRSLFVPDARLIPVRVAPGTSDPKAGPAADLRFLSVEDYAARLGPIMAEEDFYERVTRTQVEQYGNIVQVFATFESRHEPSDTEPSDRGVDSLQLLKDRGRYWIVDLYYNMRSPVQAIPPRYLPTGGSDATHLNQNLTGEWVGQLEYRDFQSNERVFLPTWLTMTPSADGSAVRLAYIYDDGPTKTVREESTLTLRSDANTASLGSDREHSNDLYAVAGLEEFRKLNRGSLVLTGPGKENDKPVDVRITLTLRRNLFTLLKETRLLGGEYKFRDQYTFTRASAPAE